MSGASHAHSAAYAADPRASVWVVASAGTGKTTVLTDRLLRLMLDGTDPARLLCLTFTRAAAAEMANRLDSELARWATLADGELVETLQRLTGGYPDQAAVARARRLFALVLDAPGGIKISTIHAFCQNLLRRFPLEAGVSPEFAVVEERDADELLAEAAQKVVIAARDRGDPVLSEALAIIADHTAEERFGELMRALAAERGKLARTLRGGHAALGYRLSTALGVLSDAKVEALTADFCAEGACDEQGLRAAAAALAVGSSTDRKRGRRIEEWLCARPGARPALLPQYATVFVKQDGEIRDRVISSPACRQAACDASAILGSEARRLLRFRQTRAAIVVRDATCALVRLGEALLHEYAEGKQLKGVLDFDDLVLTTLALLRRNGVAAWVLFKLDGGLDHILIDEAQDTNPEQWEIVRLIAEEFFAGVGARERNRTVFAVGDPKQSIYSFQRADPQSFLRMRRHFADRVSAANQRWMELPLDISFRSTEPVLRAVDAIFARPEARCGVALDGGDIHHTAHRTGHAGIVELWPPVAPASDEADGDDLPVARHRRVEPYARLARAISATVSQWLMGGERLAARDRPVAPVTSWY
jgi:ATP-dependent helicase/nuclease subunit A